MTLNTERYIPNTDNFFAGFFLILGYVLLTVSFNYLLTMWVVYKPAELWALRAILTGTVFLQIGYILNKE